MYGYIWSYTPPLIPLVETPQLENAVRKSVYCLAAIKRYVTIYCMKRDAILAALRLLGQYAKEEGIKLEVSIYGGTAFMLAYNTREATRDEDAILIPKEEGERFVLKVAKEMDLEPDWLNSNVRQFVSPKVEAKRRLAEIEDQTGLIIQVPTARYLLAMKALACRKSIGTYPGDMEDLSYLIKKMEIRSVEEIQEAIDVFYPDDVIRSQDAKRLKGLIDEYEEREKKPLD